MKSKTSSPKRRQRWVRDGSIVSGRDTQIDLRTVRGGIWITVKARDSVAEKTAAKLLSLLSR